MKAWMVVVMSLVLGVVLGVGSAWARLGSGEPVIIDDGRVKPTGPQPKWMVDATEYDFGRVERGTIISHVFHVTNAGGTTLELLDSHTTCKKCTVGKISKHKVEPGETVEVEVQYNAAIDSPEFRQSAMIRTNEEDRKTITLTVSGKVMSSFTFTPDRISFGKIAANESRTVHVRLTGYLSDKLQIVGHEFTDPDTTQFYDVEIRAMTADELRDEPDAKCGWVIAVTQKPGMPVGVIRQQKLRVILNLPGDPKVELPVEGTVTSDIGLMGQGWNGDNGVLALGAVKQKDGVKRDLFLVVRGPHRDDVKFHVEKLDPDWLKVTLGEPKATPNGQAVRVPMTVKVPPDSPLCNHWGNAQGQYGRITLGTTHPDDKLVQISVQFVVEKGP